MTPRLTAASTGMTSFQLPTPYPDELLYSVVARTAYRHGHWSPKGLMAAVFGDSTVLACPDLPCRLNLLGGVSWGLNASDIALRYTLVGYYTHFLGAAERSRVLGLMAEKASYLHLRLGICASVVVAPKKFRICPLCAELDIRHTGETYWRRAHHLPGVLVCPVHSVPLWETTIPFRPVGRHEHVYARAQFLESGAPMLPKCRVASLELLNLAKAATGLLDAPVCDSGPLHDYRKVLAARGFVGASGVAGIWRALLDCYGLEPMKALIRSGEVTRPPAWLYELIRQPRRPLHPLKHLLIEHVLSVCEARSNAKTECSGKTWGIYKEPDLRRQALEHIQAGASVRCVARQLGVAWETANRLLLPQPEDKPKFDMALLQADRFTWLAVIRRLADAGRTQMRRLEPALYARMYRRDREWLMCHGEPLKTKPGSPRVSWRYRDDALAKSVQRCAQAIKRQVPLRRASESYVLGTLGARAVVKHYGRKLPLTRAALVAGCESVEDFQLRRLIARVGVDGLRVMPVWRLMRVAGLNADRFSDKGSGLVARARKLGGMVRWAERTHDD